MIFHAVSIAAVFVDQATQTPVVVQCTPSAGQDPLWSRLFLAALPSAFALVVAWMVFRWNRRGDQRRWVLENKKTEWKELLTFASAIEQFMPSVAVGSELTKTVHDPLVREHLRDMTRSVLKPTFISEAKAGAIYDSLVKVQIVNEEAKAHIEDYGSNASLADKLGKPRPLQAAKNVQLELISIWREIRRYATEDLELKQPERWWKVLQRRPVKALRSQAAEISDTPQGKV